MIKHPLLRFFGSLKLAVVLIFSLAACLALATGIESIYGMKAVKHLVYGTPWFSGLLFLLGISLVAAAMTRFPWKRHQTGFVLTHLGNITLLVGAWLTSQFGVDGNLPVRQGTSNDEVVLNDLLLRIEEEEGKVFDIELEEFARAKEGEIKQIEFDGATLSMDRFFPRAVSKLEVKPSSLQGVGSPAIYVELNNDRFSVREWLVHRTVQPTSLNLGPALLSFDVLSTPAHRRRFETTALQKSRDPGVLTIDRHGRRIRVNIKDVLGRWMRLGDGLEMIVEKYLPYAIVENNQLVSKSDEPKNPAVTLRVRNEEGTEEKHTIFAFYPEFATLHRVRHVGRSLDVSIRMLVKSESPLHRGTLKFAQSADGKELFYRVETLSTKESKSGKVQLGSSIRTGWMDLTFKVSAWIPYAVEEQTPRYIDKITGSDAFMSAAHFTFRGPSREDAFWLFEGMERVLPEGENPVSVGLLRRSLKLPFKLFLERFTIHRDPGSDKAAGFESQVKVGDGKNGLIKISMNEPLDHGGYTFYQASYQQEEGAPPISIFSVNYDPGRWVKYAGSLFLTLGIILMFTMNPHYWSILLGKKERS